MLGLPGSLGTADGEDDGDHEGRATDPGEDDGCDDGDDAGDSGVCVADDVGDGWNHEDEEGYESEPEEHDPEVEAPLEVAAPPEPMKTLAPTEKNPDLPKDIGWFCSMINS